MENLSAEEAAERIRKTSVAIELSAVLDEWASFHLKLNHEREAKGLYHLARLAGMPLANLGETAREAVAGQFRASGGAAAATLTRVVLQCYYRDDRVLRSLGLELRPPFPLGYALEQGDWSLLDPVKARPSMWRRTS